MNPSNTYWNSPTIQVTSDNILHFSHDGILYNIPWPDPVQTNWYYGCYSYLQPIGRKSTN